MAKEKQSKTKKPSIATSTATKPSENPPLVVKKSSDVASTSKNPVNDVTTAKKKKKKPEPVKIPVPESSSDEDEELESGEEQEEPSKDSGKNPVTPSSSTPVVSATANQSSDSESESESEEEQEEPSKDSGKNQVTPSAPVVSATANRSSVSESESESEEEQEEPSKDSGKNPVTTSAPVVSATANRSSVSESESESDSETEPASTKTPPPAASASQNKRRQSEGAAVLTEVNSSKRSKTESTGTGSEKKGLFQRIWTEQDEIVLLKGIIDFRRNTGKKHSDDLSGFYETVKNSISLDVKNLHQLASKIWSLRKKYIAKRKSGGEPSFTKPHDQRCLELAKVVWDADSTAVKSKKTIEVEDGSLKNDDADWFEKSFVVGEITSLISCVDEASVREKWSVVPVEAKKKMLEEWKSMVATQLKGALQKTNLLNEVSHWICKSG